MTSRPEMAMVLLLLQATFWFGAGVSALPFALAGELFMAPTGLVTMLLAAAALWLAVAVVHRRRRWRRWAMALEVVTLAGSLLQLVLPIGANHGPVTLLVNVALPLAVLLLLGGRRMKQHFGIAVATAQ